MNPSHDVKAWHGSLVAKAAALMAVAMKGLAQPTFTTQPPDQTVNQGFNASFRTVASSTNPPLSYRWCFNSNAIPWGLTNTLVLSNTLASDAGVYFAIATDSSGSVTSRLATLTVVLPALLDPKLSANIRIGEDSPLLAGRPAQAEPHIARSFTDPKLLITAFQDGLGVDAAPWACSYAVSTNGGSTWTQAFVPGLTSVSGGTNGIAGDNVVAFDAQGAAYISSLAGPRPIAYISDMLVSKSLDGGQTFAFPRRALGGGVLSNWPDKDWLAANAFPGSPTANRIAMAYTQDEPTHSTRSFSLYSDDGGKTWSAPVLLASRSFGVQNLFLPDGSLAVVYWKFVDANYSTNGQRVEMVRSEDGGATFGPPAVVMDATGFDNPDKLYSTPRFFPSVCVDRQAGVIHVAVGALTGKTTNRADRILHTKSIDKGKTWSAPVQVNDTPARRSVFNPAMAVSPDGQHLAITFYDKRNDPGQGYFLDLYLTESFDGGDTWGPNLRLSEFSSDIRKAPVDDNGYFMGEYQGIAPSLNLETPAVAVWIDTRAGNNDPYSVRINRTRGTKFETWRKLRFSTNDLVNDGVSGENADPDGDGSVNLAEYAFGSEPNHADSHPVKIALSGSGSSAKALLEYERLAVLSDVTFSWQSSVDLANWTEIQPESESIATAHEAWLQHVTAIFGLGDRSRFVRLILTRIP